MTLLIKEWMFTFIFTVCKSFRSTSSKGYEYLQVFEFVISEFQKHFQEKIYNMYIDSEILWFIC